MIKEQIGDCTLYLGDMREIVPGVGLVDCVVTDWPYELESGGNTTKEMGGKFSKDVYANDGKIVECDITPAEFMPILYKAMPRGHAYFMCNNRYVSETQNEAEAAGFHFHNLLVWDKSTGTPNRWYMKNCEFTVMLSSGKAFYINDCGSRQLIKSPNLLNSFHKTEKPVALMEHYIRNSSQIGQTVLDSFMGVGSTGVAAVNLGRKFIGCEIVPKYFDEACRRVEAAYNRPLLI